MQETDELNNLSIFPNPSDGIINIQTGLARQDEVSVKVYNVTGNEVSNALYTSNVNDDGIALNLSVCQKGLYFVEVTTSKGKAIKKIELLK